MKTQAMLETILTLTPSLGVPYTLGIVCELANAWFCAGNGALRHDTEFYKILDVRSTIFHNLHDIESLATEVERMLEYNFVKRLYDAMGLYCNGYEIFEKECQRFCKAIRELQEV